MCVHISSALAFIFIAGPGGIETWPSLIDRVRSEDEAESVTFDFSSYTDVYQLLFPLMGLAILVGTVAWSRRAATVEFSAPKEPQTQSDPAKTYFNHQTVKIAGLLGADADVRDKTFEDCEIIGPGVIHFDHSALMHNSFRSPLDHLFREVEPGASFPGAIKFTNCTFRRCTFNNRITIIGSPDLRKQLKANFESV